MPIPNKHIAVTPHDTNALSSVISGFIASGAGDVTCRLLGDSADAVIPNCVSGGFYEFQISHIRATGTTATGIKGYYEE